MRKYIMEQCVGNVKIYIEKGEKNVLIKQTRVCLFLISFITSLLLCLSIIYYLSMFEDEFLFLKTYFVITYIF